MVCLNCRGEFVIIYAVFTLMVLPLFFGAAWLCNALHRLATKKPQPYFKRYLAALLLAPPVLLLTVVPLIDPYFRMEPLAYICWTVLGAAIFACHAQFHRLSAALRHRILWTVMPVWAVLFFSYLIFAFVDLDKYLNR